MTGKPKITRIKKRSYQK